jgi:DNA-binding CsgD family transcriptional regulator
LIQKEDMEVQKIAALYFWDEMTIKDIANLLGLNENTTKTKLYRLIKKLKSLNVEE